MVGAANDSVSEVPRDFTVWELDSQDVSATTTRLTLEATDFAPFASPTDRYTLVGSRLSWQLPTIATGTGVQLTMNLRASGSNANMLRFVLNNGTLTARYVVASSNTTLDTRAWDSGSSGLSCRCCPEWCF